MMRQAAWLAATLVFGLGLYSLLTQRNLIRICIALTMMETALLIALTALAFCPGGQAPIIVIPDQVHVDPLPHALALTAIVIGAAVIALALALVILIYRQHGSLDIETLADNPR